MSERSRLDPIMIVGNSGQEHVGSHLCRAAEELHLTVHFADTRGANGGWLTQKASWNLLQRRPARLHAFSRSVADLCAQYRPRILLSTGFAPIAGPDLDRIGSLGAYRVNYLTDDPWNPAQRAPWFLRAIRSYDEVLSTRRANLSELRALGCRRVGYLPFGYAPHMYFSEQLAPDRMRALETDIMFAGGADTDRLPYITALAEAGFHVGLYGAYWERFAETRGLTHGFQSPTVVRAAVAAAKVVLCLVRRANRDGTCMRTFEVPAVGACMLVEKTDEHLDLFGPEGQAVLYFDTIPEMIEKTRWLLEHQTERRRLRDAAHRVIVGGEHTYRDRLAAIIQRADTSRSRGGPIPRLEPSAKVEGIRLGQSTE
jgi:spore maturation protein CgeB